MACTTGSRSSPKNMCSVRQRPIPSAPSSRALAASPGVSALARTRSRRTSSAQPVIVSKSSFSCAGTSGTAPSITSPVPPSIVIWSPSDTTVPSTLNVRASRSICRCSAPATQGFPICRATTAACEVMPPRAVSTPCACSTPWMSSGVVSHRTRITACSALPRCSAVSASNTTAPTAAPGEAFRPRVSTSRGADGSMAGCSSWSS